MPQHRRRFLRSLGGASALAAVGMPRALHAEEAPHPQATDNAFDMAWTDRINGKFRAVFDSPEISDGAGMFRAVMWCDQYAEVYKTKREEMSPVLVIRHMAIPLAMNDEYWKKYKVGKATKMKGPDGKWLEVNPIRTSAPNMPPQFAKYDLEHLMSSGGIVLACNLAFAQVVANVRRVDKLDAKAARARAIEMLIPGIILQPSGIFAALRAQEAGCKYILAS